MFQVSREQTKDKTPASSDTDVTTDAHPTTKGERRFPKLFWLWEFMAIIASIICMLAVVIVLALMRDKPLTHWTLPISLNATVAVFITIAKSMSLLVIGACIAQSKWTRFKSSAIRLQEFDFFDEAARGPLGSLILLSRVRWGLASIGAIATILALGVDTFAQQVIRFDTRTIETLGGHDASFSLSYGYFGGANWTYSRAAFVAENTVDVAMQGAILRGIYNVPTTPDFRCTHNCTWKDSYTSLGFASNCHNVTEPTLATIVASQAQALGDVSAYWRLNMTTPGNLTLKIKLHPYYRTQIQVVAKATNTFEDISSIREGVVSPELVRVGVLRRRADTENGGYYDEGEGPIDYVKELEVFDCAIGFIAYNYTAMSASGNDISITREPIELLPGTLHGKGSNNIQFIQENLPIFSANAADIEALNDLFQSPRFMGNMTSGQIPNEAASGVVVALLTSNISQVFDNLADSMTEQLRTRPDAVAEGLILVNEVFVRIEWDWLILPFIVTLTAAIFLIATCVESRAQGCLPLKSSSVALLYHEIAPQEHGKVVLKSDMSSLCEMAKAAKKTKVTLQ